jgi:hypothetical protein
LKAPLKTGEKEKLALVVECDQNVVWSDKEKVGQREDWDAETSRN